MRPLVRAAVAGLAALAVLTGAGCTLSADDPGQDPTPAPATQAGPDPSPRPTATDEPADGPGTEELSELIFDAAAETEAPLASQTVELGVANQNGVTAPVTFDVLSVRRTSDATLVRFQMSTSEAELDMSSTALGDGSNTEFFFRTALEDPAAGTRYLPLSYRWDAFDVTEIADRPVNGCLCGYAGGRFLLSPEPLVMDVLYPPLPPEVTTVTFAAPGGLSIPGLTVTG